MEKKSWYQMMAVVLCLSILTACATLADVSEEEDPESICCDELLELRSKVIQLEKLLAEKEKLILKQNQIQQKQIQVQQEAHNEISRAQLKLHRLATKPSTASTIAEVEVAMERLKQRELTDSDQRLEVQAQIFLDAAVRLYQQEGYTSSMSYASQAYEIINMALDQGRTKISANRTLVGFHVPITLRAITDINMRHESNLDAQVLQVLKKNTNLIANAYQGNWLRVQVEGNGQGWVHNSLVEARLNGDF